MKSAIVLIISVALSLARPHNLAGGSNAHKMLISPTAHDAAAAHPGNPNPPYDD